MDKTKTPKLPVLRVWFDCICMYCVTSINKTNGTELLFYSGSVLCCTVSMFSLWTDYSMVRGAISLCIRTLNILLVWVL